MAIENVKLIAPLNTHSVARYMGANTLDVGSLCTSELVNTNAFHRPIGGTDTVQELSDEDRYNCNDGYNIEDAICDTLNDAAAKYDNGAYKWGVIDPTTFRLTDFIGYNRTANDFSPTSTETLYPSGGLTEITLSYFADIQEHVHKLSVIQGLSSFGYLGVHLGFIIWLKRESDFDYTKYLYTRGFYDGWKTTQKSIKLEKALTDYNQEAQQEKFEFKAIPIIFDNGKGTSATSTPYTLDTLYDSTQLNGNLVSLNNATFKFVALPGNPISGTFKTLMYEIANNVYIVFRSFEGSFYRPLFGTAKASWNGEIAIKNNNDFVVSIKVHLYTTAYYPESATNPNRTLSIINKDFADIKGNSELSYSGNVGEWNATTHVLNLAISVKKSVTDYGDYQKDYAKEVSLPSDIDTFPREEVVKLSQ